MIKKLIVTLAAAALSITPTRGEAFSIAGMWEANFKGAIFLRVNLTDGDSIAGAVSVGSIGVDYEGNLIMAEPAAPENETPILHAVFDGPTLKFDIDDDGEITKIEITFTEARKAVIHFPDLAQKVKPIELARR